MRGQTLLKLLQMYRAETRVSLNAAHNVQIRESQVMQLQRTQERLWNEFDWPHLVVERDYPLADGVRFYDVTNDFDIDRVFRVLVKDGNIWRTVSPTLDPADYSVWDSQRDEKSWPVRQWRLYEGEKIEFWPTPDRAGATDGSRDAYFKVRGVRKLNPLVADTDRADLDDILVTLYAAAEALAATGAKDASLKLDQAKARQTQLQGAMTKARRFKMFGDDPCRRPSRRSAITSYRGAIVP